MEAVIFLSIIIALFSILVSCFAIRRVKKQIAEITDALIDVKNGNGNRRILSATNELVAPLAYEINEIVVSYESRLSTVRQTEETNRQLMTSLSHDVRTPLTTLIGYLDAAHKGIVTGKDRDDYIETARRKAHDLKEYIDVLFDWFKLNSNEFAMDINIVEAAELTRNILIDWIPIFEDKQIDYNIDIPEQPFRVKLDTDGYMRILNNLIQNGALLEEESLAELEQKSSKHIRFTLSDTAQAARILERTFHESHFSIQDDHNLRLHNLDLSVGKIVTAFVENGLEVSEAHTCEESLEDYFKRVTGGEGIA